MLFMAIQTHSPEGCPANGNNAPLWDTNNKKVAIIQMYSCPPAHIIYFVLNAESLEDIQEFFAPGMNRATVDIKVVMDTTPVV